jgi:hypothetical protein
MIVDPTFSCTAVSEKAYSWIHLQNVVSRPSRSVVSMVSGRRGYVLSNAKRNSYDGGRLPSMSNALQDSRSANVSGTSSRESTSGMQSTSTTLSVE